VLVPGFRVQSPTASWDALWFVLVQRLSSTGLVTLKKVTLDASSAASFRVRLHQGRSRLRVVMPSSQTAPGYITGTSNVLTVGA